MSKLLDILHLGNPILREKATPIDNVFDDDIQALIDDMLATVKDSKGVGLAGPQVGVSKQIFIVSPAPNQRYPHISVEDTLVVINPHIEILSKKSVTDWEGCLSIPGFRGLVSRDDCIRVTYVNRIGEQKTEEYDGFVARIIQHEYDHLNGVLFLDRMTDLSSLMTEDEHFRQYSQDTEDDS